MISVAPIVPVGDDDLVIVGRKPFASFIPYRAGNYRVRCVNERWVRDLVCWAGEPTSGFVWMISR